MSEIIKPKKRFRWTCCIERLNLDQEILIFAEVGIWKGKMSAQLLSQVPNLYLIMADRWCPPLPGDSYFNSGSLIANGDQTSFDNAYKETIERVSSFNSRYKIYKMLTTEAAKKVKDDVLDGCFIDGDHSKLGTKADIKAWYPKVKPGCYIGGHDWGKPSKGDVEGAVRECFENERIELDANSCWFVKKI